MDIRNSYPDFIPIEEHIRRAKLERSLVIAQFLADGADGVVRGFRKLMEAFSGIKGEPALTLPKEPVHR